jgi:hypothetical protein
MFGPTYLSYNLEETGVQFHQIDSIDWGHLVTAFVVIGFYSTAKSIHSFVTPLKSFRTVNVAGQGIPNEHRSGTLAHRQYSSHCR